MPWNSTPTVSSSANISQYIQQYNGCTLPKKSSGIMANENAGALTHINDRLYTWPLNVEPTYNHKATCSTKEYVSRWLYIYFRESVWGENIQWRKLQILYFSLQAGSTINHFNSFQFISSGILVFQLVDYSSRHREPQNTNWHFQIK